VSVPGLLDPDEVLAWFARAGRAELPWRATRDPWAVLVAEVMLQQTQVARVVPRWHGFLERFPDPAACAAAPAAEVLRAWEGLGYNRRGLALHRCAVEVVERHGGALPVDLAALLALPGVGPYTARAVLVFAGERPHGVLDTNIARVLARVTGRTLRAGEAQGLADALVPDGAAWAWNSALMDLGATVCGKRAPQCGVCPVADRCAWRGEGPDPAVGSAAVPGPQSRFAGSDRQGRGRLVAALRAGPVPGVDVPAVMGWPDDPARAARVLDGLVRDGLVVAEHGSGRLRLP
jgi:A/G-specific adenine glycosylase